MDKNPELELAWEYVTRTSMNVFLTGKAGTGKTTFLKKVVAECPKRKIVLAPTGVAAINAGGVTLHSFFQLPFGLFLPDFQHVQAHDKEGRYKFHKKKLRLIRSIELMIIDEVSMLRADVMDELDSLLRKLRRNPDPFGGVQLLMIGDVQQLSPVVKPEEWEVMSKYYVSPYFFDSKVLKEHPYRLVELSHIFRQRDSEFIDVLAAVRENRMTPALLEKLNSRYVPDYQAPDGCITLCTHNFVAKNINDSRLDQIQSRAYTFTAVITGNFPESMYPQDVELVLKKGAQVMFTKNDPNPEHLYVNGTLGTVISIGPDHITVRLENGEEVEVEPLPWENLKYDINEETKEIVSEIDGLFTQYPLKTAWAITIHKSQGLTFDKAVIDASDSFSHGQVYVALSRCRTLEGMVLKRRILPSAIINDHRVDEFTDYVAESLPSMQNLEADKRAYYLEVLKDLFDIGSLKKYYYTYFKFARATFPGIYPKALTQWANVEPVVKTDMAEVGVRFGYSLNKIILKGVEGELPDAVKGEAPAGMSPQTYAYLQERVKKAASYFREIGVQKLLPLVKVAYSVDFDDKDKKKLNHQYFSNFTEILFQKIFLWNYVSVGFDLETFLSERAILAGEVAELSVSRLLGLLSKAIAHPGTPFNELSKPKKKSSGEKGSSDRKEEEPDVSEYEQIEDVTDPVLFEKLRRWRKEKAEEQNIPAYCILQQKPLVAIVNALPSTPAELLTIKGVGKTFLKKYGDEILTLINGEGYETRSEDGLFQ